MRPNKLGKTIQYYILTYETAQIVIIIINLTILFNG